MCMKIYPYLQPYLLPAIINEGTTCLKVNKMHVTMRYKSTIKYIYIQNEDTPTTLVAQIGLGERQKVCSWLACLTVQTVWSFSAI